MTTRSGRPRSFYRRLDWDSGVFGFPVGEIVAPHFPPDALHVALAEARADGRRLVYWRTAEAGDSATLAETGGSLVDRKVTFVACPIPRPASPDDKVGARGSANPDGARLEPQVEPCLPGMPVADLEALAIQSGEYSRFAFDPDFPRDKFLALYRIWIQRSLAKEIADEVLAVRDGGRAVAMITLGARNGRGDIGLVAVDAAYRRRGLGKRLFDAAHAWFGKRNLAACQVVTQERNREACALYHRLGYRVERVEYVHHFWL
jgi:dTDP-4-amino-4,6-dideoxy-D-galactose acyltransferase